MSGIGDAEAFAGLFGKAEQPKPEESNAPDAPLERDEQAELARRYNLPAELASRVRGASWTEKCEDAERLAALLPQPESTIKERARRHLREQLGIGADQGKTERNAAFVRLLHGGAEPSDDQQGQ